MYRCDELFLPDEPHDAVTLIGAERARQNNLHGFTAKHDDEHVKSELLYCASFVMDDVMIEGDGLEPVTLHEALGWTAVRANRIREKHKDDQIRRLVIAAALIAAEIDRRIRIEDKKP